MTDKRLKPLTERQKKVLELIEYFIREYGYPPNDREICQMANIASGSSVRYVLSQLEEMGYLEIDSHVGRGLRLIKTAEQVPVALRLSEYFGKQAVDILEIPLAGRIFASIPIPFPAADVEPAEDATKIEFPRNWLPENLTPTNLFAFEVRGASMLDALVNDGDFVILQPEKTARNGEFVAVWLKERAKTALRYFYLEAGRVRLQPANPTLGPAYFDDPTDVEVQGRVVSVLRASFNGQGASELLSTITFHIPNGSKLTPSYLVEGILPYIKTITDLQEMILQIQGQERQEVVIKSISQASPIRVSFEGAKDAIEIIQKWVVPWRRSHTESMARIQERKVGIEIGLAEAEVRAEELMRVKDKVEYEKLAVEIDLKRQSAKELQAENEHAELELQSERLSLVMKILEAYGPWLSEEESSKWVPQILSPVIQLTSIQIEVG